MLLHSHKNLQGDRLVTRLRETAPSAGLASTGNFPEKAQQRKG